ncbi:mavicyanin-like [Punica granatum]|uniref:Phytocyanin domain-containing protein n=2 Tax=Punica granatum TaxID=22663 RepID=A0A218WZB1_PUNGR|nr:mavicyanin-like [Punica granatum]OWM78117.1 hypothetical protein CDL15_Pgr014936 [Punica granatum]PKI45523.1 hypothetical protein CRG98_034041 [Punica granatum]
MASLSVLLFGCLVILAATNNLAMVEGMKEFKVGGTEGWREPPQNNTSMYNDWAMRKRFHIGDSLVFKYKNDSVLVVDKFSYYHCNTSNPILALNNGNSTIMLDRPGPFYFMSGDPIHCRNGQRLLVEVMSQHPIHHSPPSVASPPESGSISPALSPLSSSGAFATATMFSPMVIAFVAAVVVPA